MKHKIAETGCAPFAGSGKLSDFREDGSWMMNQISKGYKNVQRGIQVKEDGDSIRFAKQNKMAFKIANEINCISFNKKYFKLQDNLYVVCYSICFGEDEITLSELNVINELLNVKISNDLELFYETFQDKLSINSKRDGFIDAKNKCIKCCLKIETTIDDETFFNFLNSNEFEQQEIKVII